MGQVVTQDGTRVKIGSRILGTVRFHGYTEFAPGEWLGIETDDMVGQHDGMEQGVRYFRCPPRHGVFVRPSAVSPHRDFAELVPEVPLPPPPSLWSRARSQPSRREPLRIMGRCECC